MTQNQINYWKAMEEKRHNMAMERETKRHNVASLSETTRHNYATEAVGYDQAIASMTSAKAALSSAGAAYQNALTNSRLADVTTLRTEAEINREWNVATYQMEHLAAQTSKELAQAGLYTAQAESESFRPALIQAQTEQANTSAIKNVADSITGGISAVGTLIKIGASVFG